MHPEAPERKEASAASKAQFAQEVADMMQKKLASKQHQQQWSSKMEQLAATVGHRGALPLDRGGVPFTARSRGAARGLCRSIAWKQCGIGPPTGRLAAVAAARRPAAST
jgi:hypothetical protein